jgi:alpha-tubulin suppressor-like RCC1 family protein
MRTSRRTKTISAAFALSFYFLCLTAEAMATENRKASVSNGTLYMVQEDGSVLRYGPGSIFLRDKGPFSDDISQVLGLDNMVGISVGQNHALALDSDGCIWAWGLNKYNQLGFQGESRVKTPRKFESLCGVEDFDSSYYASIVLFGDSNTVKIWGADIKYEFQGRRYKFEEKLKGVVSSDVSYVITQAGRVYAWGDSGSMPGMLGKKEKLSWEPKKLEIPCRVKQIDIGLDVMFVCESGDVYMFGSNRTGTLGNGNTRPVEQITKHPTLSGVEKIMGSGIRIAKTYSGKYLGWGDQLLGPIEWTNSGYVLDPMELQPPEGVIDFYSQESSIFFMHKDGSVFRLVPEEHWLFPVKYSLEDYSFKKYQSKDINKE